MAASAQPSRRSFLAGAAALSAGALVGGRLPAAAHAAEAGHGTHGVPLRGMYLTSKDRLAEGRFGAMFKRLPAFAPRDDLLDGLARTMVEDQTAPTTSHLNTSARLFAGYTFIGQFIDHDITFDDTPAQPPGRRPVRHRQLPDAALRPRLGLRTRPGTRTAVLRRRRPRQAADRAERRRRPGPAQGRKRPRDRPGGTQRREPRRQPVPPGGDPVPQRGGRPGPATGRASGVGLRDRAPDDPLALPVGRRPRLPAAVRG